MENENCQPGFDVTFDTVTEESAAAGDSARRGWWMPGEWLHDEHPGELAFEFDPEEHAEEHADVDDAVIEWAVGVLRNEGATHPNCHPSDNADWWGTEGNEVLDYSTGETIRKSFHFRGFSDRQRERINLIMAGEVA